MNRHPKKSPPQRHPPPPSPPSPPPYMKEPENSSRPKPVIIALFGKTGTGKSSFIKAVTGQDITIGHSLESCTQEVEAVYHKIGDQDVQLVDTPGFDDTNVSDTEILQRIADWLRASYDDGARLTGIIYLQRISDPRMDGASMKNLRMFRRLCGANNFGMVKLATTMWKNVSEAEGARRQQELEQEYWKEMIGRGSTVHRISKHPEDATNLVESFLGKPTTILQLQDELKRGKSLRQTEAGAAIRAEMERLHIQYAKDLREAKEEMKAAQLSRDIEYAKLWKADIARLNRKVDAMKKDEAKLNGTKKSRPRNRKRWWQSSWKCLWCERSNQRPGKWNCKGCEGRQKNVKY